LNCYAIGFVDVLVIKDLIKHASSKKKGKTVVLLSQYSAIVF